ncbi:unnamed protein product [Spirodela intermedia]|uniref:Uncharacterized protein n=1 Tax=Spirodela intermedia TaxID=51605 RepID=A0A7I8J382_SPIIN|nr:unnamed protein product [Spirodela intermedia]CAA6664432.1 unnamed protein product [Spirodela intermedia]
MITLAKLFCHSEELRHGIYESPRLLSLPHLPTPPISAATVPPSPRIKAVNLGGWLVTEGWIKPSLFDGIANKDLLYLCAEGGGGSVIVANRSSASGWETFNGRLDRFQFRVFLKQFVSVNAGGNAVAVATTPGLSETFEIVRRAGDPNRVRIRALNGLFLQAKTENSVTADFVGNSNWGATTHQEYQVTNGYGPSEPRGHEGEEEDNHWQSFIVEKDFKFMKDNGLNAVRVPVGWWIASDPNPPAPYVGGSLAALDKAFTWAEKYGLKVIIDLHAAPGSQNGYEHSGGRDGSIDWGVAGSGNVEKTVTVIEFLTRRVDFDTLKSYYPYDAVRRHTSTAYVIFSARLSADAGEFIPFASGLDGTVLDVHYYNLFSSIFDGWTTTRGPASSPQSRTPTAAPSPSSVRLIFHLTPFSVAVATTGEWVAEWNVNGATADDYRRFGEAQLKVFSNASFGWAYWTYRNVNNHWSLSWMITNGYISLL